MWLLFIAVQDSKDEYLLVCLTIKSLLGVDCVVSIILHNACRMKMDQSLCILATCTDVEHFKWPGAKMYVPIVSLYVMTDQCAAKSHKYSGFNNISMMNCVSFQIHITIISNIPSLPCVNGTVLYFREKISEIIKSSRNCARCDWPVRVHYSSIKHSAYVTRVLYGVIMHAAYVTSFSARIFFNIL